MLVAPISTARKLNWIHPMNGEGLLLKGLLLGDDRDIKGPDLNGGLDGLLAANLLLIFKGHVLTCTAMIIQG